MSEPLNDDLDPLCDVVAGNVPFELETDGPLLWRLIDDWRRLHREHELLLSDARDMRCPDPPHKSDPPDVFADPSNERLDQWRAQAGEIVNGTADRQVELEVADAVDELVSTVRRLRRENELLLSDTRGGAERDDG